MKKIFVVFAVFAALIFVVSCGGGSKTGDTTDTGDTVTDGDIADDNDPSDSGHENPDTTPEQPDNGDTAPDNGDTTHDDGDSAPDNGDTQPDDDDPDMPNENPDNLPECSPESSTPCIDSEAVNSDLEKTNLIWSGKSSERLRWIDAVDYCKNLNEGGYSDWQLPTLAALKTLVRTCGSDGYSDGKCSKFGDIVFLWSSSTNGSSESQGVFFYNGKTQSKNVDETFDLRCVRRDFETRNVNCKGLPENAKWNSVSQITQTWDWNEVLWLPSQTGQYSEEPSTTKCRFKCEENYFFDQDSNQCLNPCDPNPCAEVENSTKVCTALASNEIFYICGCVSGYHWWGPETGCTDTKLLGNICTGQDKCYNASSSNAVITCPTSESADFFGQDAYYASLGKCTPRSFTVQTISSQKVVLDNNTGLMWQQTIERDDWSDALSYCDGLTYAGYSDWRLPTPQELLTIVDNGRYNPAIDTAYFPDTPSYDFWSSSSRVDDINYAWYVDFSYGSVSSFNDVDWYEYTNKENIYNVRCVRETTLSTSTFYSLTVNGDKIVTNTKTGLVWQKSYVSGRTWQEALSYCESLTYAGYSDWRLPDKNELASLVNYEKYNPASDFPDMPSNDFFWSSSTLFYYSTNYNSCNSAWYVDFSNGTVYVYNKADNGHVRCVR